MISGTANGETMPSNDMEIVEIEGRNATSLLGPGPASAVDSQIVQSWLRILLDPEMNREPEEFYIERNILQEYRERVPKFSEAAQSWPLHALAYWETIGPLVRQLFSSRYNFMHWALEYARVSYPGIYGAQAPSNDDILDLTDILYGGTFSPLHLSAALGLEPLCLELMEKPELPGSMFSDRAASPLFCSLAGPQFFICGTSMMKWQDKMHLGYPDRSEFQSRLPTIKRLLDLNRQKRISYETAGQKGRLLMFLAFRATVVTGHHSLLKQVLEGGGDARAVIDLINDDEISSYELSDSFAVSEILNSILDLVLAPSKLNLLERDRQALINAIHDAFLLNLGASVASCPVELTEDEFQEALKDAFLDDTIICFKRLMHHPSFDPNAPSPNGAANGTLLHHAVCDSLVEFADLIVEAGGDLDARDHMGRTPLLLCNDTETLAMLVKEHDASTTAVDNEGRNIWHYAAATTDVPIVMWLAGHDPHKDENLRAATKDGVFPMDMALKTGLESLESDEKKKLDAGIVAQVLLSNDAAFSPCGPKMNIMTLMSKIVKNEPQDEPPEDLSQHSATTFAELRRYARPGDM